MRKYFILVVIAVMLSGCGTKDKDIVISKEETQVERETEKTSETEVADKVTETDKEYYEDNFSVSREVVEKYARTIQQAVEEKDINKLADLVTYPVYVGLGEGQIIESREAFIELDATEVFTDELLQSVENADESGLEPCQAGFVLWSGEGAPGIVFSIQEGQLGITGINY